MSSGDKGRYISGGFPPTNSIITIQDIILKGRFIGFILKGGFIEYDIYCIIAPNFVL